MRPLLFGSGKAYFLYTHEYAQLASMRPLLFGSGKRQRPGSWRPVKRASMRPLLFGSGKGPDRKYAVFNDLRPALRAGAPQRALMMVAGR